MLTAPDVILYPHEQPSGQVNKYDPLTYAATKRILNLWGAKQILIDDSVASPVHPRGKQMRTPCVSTRHRDFDGGCHAYRNPQVRAPLDQKRLELGKHGTGAHK